MFQVGQKVVCVDDGNRSGRICHPKKDNVYIVDGHDPYFDAVYIYGFHHLGDQGLRASYWSNRFRPAVEKKTDISIFTKMLDGELVR